MEIINRKIINEISASAQNSPRKRHIKNFHTEPSDLLQRMINVMLPGTYVQPHKHSDPEKREVFIILKGKAYVVIFSENGEIIDNILLDPKQESFGVEIPPNEWHTIIPIEESVCYELKDGPYDPNTDKNFAPWAPMEDSEGMVEYQENLIKRIDS